jgi:hypothetical protein
MPSTNVADPAPMPLAVSVTIDCAESTVLSTIICEPSTAALKVLQAVNANAATTNKYFIVVTPSIVKAL